MGIGKKKKKSYSKNKFGNHLENKLKYTKLKPLINLHMMLPDFAVKWFINKSRFWNILTQNKCLTCHEDMIWPVTVGHTGHLGQPEATSCHPNYHTLYIGAI